RYTSYVLLCFLHIIPRSLVLFCTDVSFVRLLLALFFFSATATSEIYTLSLHDALPICVQRFAAQPDRISGGPQVPSDQGDVRGLDRKSTRLNSSHVSISYAVFCLKKKKKKKSGVDAAGYRDHGAQRSRPSGGTRHDDRR